MRRREAPERPPSFADLYTAGVIPQGHELRESARAIDFGFVDETLSASSVEEVGRPAYPPARLFTRLLRESTPT